MRIVKNISCWVRHSKINEDGILLCTETLACEGERFPGLYSCAQHALDKRSRCLRSRPSKSERWQARLENRNRLNFSKKGSHIKDSKDMAEYLQKSTTKLPPKWFSTRAALSGCETTQPVYFVDCESDGCGNLLEIAVISSTGRVIIDTTINNKVSVKELIKSNNPRFHNYIYSIYDPGLDHLDDITCGLTLDEVEQILVEGGITDRSIMIEWSVNNFDFHTIWKAFERNRHNGGSFLPNKELWLKGITDLWSKIIPGSPSYALDLLHAMVFPESGELPHHRALLDTKKLKNMVEKAMEVCL
ncbi:hypothetical protein BGZ60DRAFT_393010 [Tricladium varicosporioides]|nr:hypothetical protein BGZ60DRAFT_393010 [Hymenoscyphus varicosporioides]